MYNFFTDFFYRIDLLLHVQVYFSMACFFIFGTLLASFLNVVIFRTPKIIDYEDSQAVKSWLEDKQIPIPKELADGGALDYPKISLSLPRSHCPHCNSLVKWYQNIPILSYVFLGGKCGSCKTKISIQYPIIEILGGLSFAFLYWYFLQTSLIDFALLSFVFFSCVALFFIDLKHYILPDSLTLPIIVAGLGFAALGIGFREIDLQQSLFGAAAGYIICYTVNAISLIVLKKQGIGEGDFKLLAGFGTLIGIKGVIVVFLLSSIIGILLYIMRRIFGIKSEQEPFGPSLIIAFLLYVFFQTSINAFIAL